jgi:hypothetical protein
MKAGATKGTVVMALFLLAEEAVRIFQKGESVRYRFREVPMDIAFEGAVHPVHFRVFDTDPDNVLLITDQLPDTTINFAYPTHIVRFGRAYEIDDSFAYHHVSEAFEHQRFIRGRKLLVEEEHTIANCLTLRDGHAWVEAKTHVGAYWFQ